MEGLRPQYQCSDGVQGARMISIKTFTVQSFLNSHDFKCSRVVLLLKAVRGSSVQRALKALEPPQCEPLKMFNGIVIELKGQEIFAKGVLESLVPVFCWRSGF